MMSANIQQDSNQILCDMCTEDRKPAMKTCMKCEISMCVMHIQAHLTTPVLLQTHPLTEPMALCGTTKCPQHGKLLEYYCLDDLTCVCVSCAIEDQHRLHNMKTFSTAHKELVEKLEAEQNTLDMKTDDVNLSLEKWEQSEEEKVGQRTLRLVEAVTNLRDISLTRVRSSVSARMVSMTTCKDSIRAALKEKDTFRFLQMYSGVHQDVNAAKAVDLRKGLEPGTDRDNLVEEVTQEGEEMVEQAGQLWSSLLTLIDPENHEDLSEASSDLIFNKLTLGQGMSLSKDKKQLFHSTWKGKISPRVILIKNKLSVRDFRRWAIKFSENCDWTVGVCDKNYSKEMKNGDVYALHCQGKQLFSLKTEEEDSDAARPAFSQKSEHSNVLSLKVIQFPDNNVKEMDQPQIIEVVYKSHDSVSFFSRIGQHQRLKIVTVKITSGTVDLVPFVCLEKDEPRKNTDMSLKVPAVAIPTPGSRQQQVPTSWECYCGYKHVGSIPQRPPQACRQCGLTVGTPFFTEVLCELL